MLHEQDEECCTDEAGNVDKIRDEVRDAQMRSDGCMVDNIGMIRTGLVQTIQDNLEATREFNHSIKNS
jgi:hypothetical protein